MPYYTLEDFETAIYLIDQFNTSHGKKKHGLTYDQINDHLLGGNYRNLLTHIKGQINFNKHGISGERVNKSGKFGGIGIDEIVSKLAIAFEIPKEVFTKKDIDFKISIDVVTALRKRFLEEIESSHDIILIGSTYQGKQLEVAPRSIFKINLKSKKITFEYHGEKNAKNVETITGTLSGDRLIYMTFNKGSNKKMYILKKGPLSWDKVKFIQGTYVGDDGESPMAGSLFCEKMPNIETALKRLHKPLETGIQYRLLYSQIREQTEALVSKKQLAKHHFNVAAKEIDANFKGTYYGCFLSSQGLHSIFQAKLLIKGDGTAVFYWHHNKEGEKGCIYLSGNKKRIFLRFKYNEKLNIFKYFITLTRNGSRFHGCYGGESNLMALPETGRIIFLKIDKKNAADIPLGRIDMRNEKKLDQFIKDSKVGAYHNDAIKFLLGYKINQTDNDFSDTPWKIFEDTQFDKKNRLESNPSHPKNQEIPAAYFGFYSGYIVHYFEGHPNYRIQKIGLEINENKVVIASSKNRKYKGEAIYYVADDKLSFHLAHEEQYPEIHHILEATTWKKYGDLVILRGTYTGTGRTAQNYPIGGRIIFFKEKDKTSIDQISVQDFSLSNARDLVHLEENKPGLLDFFLGRKDKMTEGYALYKESGFLPITSTKFETIKDQVSGFYLSFRIRTDLKSISIVPLTIDLLGNVKMKSTEKKNAENFKEYDGVCDVNDVLFSMQFHTCGGAPLVAQSKFNKSSRFVDIEKNNILMGLFSSSNSEYGRPFACKQILIFQGKDISPYESTTPKIIPITAYPKTPSSEFVELNIQYNNILNYLIGAEYNMIRMSRGPIMNSHFTKENGFKKGVNYGEVFFLAAVEYYYTGKMDDAKKMWKHAIQNGFEENEFIASLIKKHPDAWNFFEQNL